MRTTEDTLKIKAYRVAIDKHSERLEVLTQMFGDGSMNSSHLLEYGECNALIERYNKLIGELGGSVS